MAALPVQPKMDWEKNVSRAANVDAVCQLRAFDPSTSSICLRILAARSSIGLSYTPFHRQ